MLCKRTSKNQLTIPKAIAGKIPGIEYFDASVEGGSIVLRPVNLRDQAGRDLEAIRDRMVKLGVTEKDLASAIGDARRRTRP